MRDLVSRLGLLLFSGIIKTSFLRSFEPISLSSPKLIVFKRSLQTEAQFKIPSSASHLPSMVLVTLQNPTSTTK